MRYSCGPCSKEHCAHFFLWFEKKYHLIFGSVCQALLFSDALFKKLDEESIEKREQKSEFELLKLYIN